jgi:hypothetical protein
MSYVNRAIQIVSQAFSPGGSPTLAATLLPRKQTLSTPTGNKAIPNRFVGYNEDTVCP